jgi:ElaB/YqjD/DUF883 family membrane-anchored ribosome-binding protein
MAQHLLNSRQHATQEWQRPAAPHIDAGSCCDSLGGMRQRIEKNFVKEQNMDTNSTSATGSDRPAGATYSRTDTNGVSGGVVSSVDTMAGTSSGNPRSAASLRTELSSLKSDLDALVNRSASLSDEELAQAHAQLMTKFSTMRYAAKGIANEAGRQLNRGVETTSTFVKDKPMQSVAVAVGTGLLLGLLFKRR